MTSSQFDIDAVRSWLEYLHGDSQGWIHICSTNDWSGLAFPLADEDWLSKATTYVAKLNNQNRQGIYLRVTTIKEPVTTGRGTDSDSLSFPGLWADIDVAGPGHKTDKPLPIDWRQARNIVQESGLPEPTLWVASGGGYYPYWLLRQAYNVEDSEQLGALQQLSTGWQRCLGEAAERLGMFYGTQCGDLARVLRIPGTVNRKTDEERPCYVDTGGGPQYTLEQLVQYFEDASRKLKVADDQGSYDRVPLNPRDGDSPFDVFESRVDWDDADLLGGLGWQISHQRGTTTYWTRPGKSKRDGHSATTGRSADRDRMYMFSDADSVIPAGGPYTKGYVYSLIHHAGNMSNAAKDLLNRGFGQARTMSQPPDQFQFDPQPEGVPEVRLIRFSNDDIGNGERMLALYGKQFKFVTDLKKWAKYNGKQWKLLDSPDDVKYAAAMMARQMADEAAAGDQDDDFVKLLRKWAARSTATARTDAAVANFRMIPQVRIDSYDLDKDARYLGVQNGVIDLGTELTDVPVLLPSSPDLMITKLMAASYHPDAPATRWEKFMEEIIPDAELREFLQRMCGYALLGKPNYRAMAILSGPPRSGKSKFIESISHVFGQYGGTAAAALFRQKRDGTSPTVDLHHLRGKRFVATSESSESTVMDEELIKRVTGMDKVNSRGLYENPQEWLPQFVLFMATNHHPRVNPEDNATWDRLKVIPFEQEFRGDGDDPFLLDKLVAEADGILSWLIEGLRKFRELGRLDEPEQVVVAGNTYRRENDTVSQFVDSSVEEQVLFTEPGAIIQNAMLYEMYDGWCARNKVGPAIGPRKFARRLESLGFERSGPKAWSGLRPGTHGMLGRMGPLYNT